MRTLSCTCPQSKCRVRNRQQHGGTTYTFDHDGYGNQTAVKAGDRTLERYSYAPNNGPLTKISYGNGDVQEILSDQRDRYGGSKCVTTGSICVPKNIMILKSLKVQEKSFQAFLSLLEWSRKKNKSSRT